MSPFLAWGDFHARWRFAGSTIPEVKWRTTRSLKKQMESGNNTDEIEVDFKVICAEALVCHLAGEPLKSLDRQCGKA